MRHKNCFWKHDITMRKIKIRRIREKIALVLFVISGILVIAACGDKVKKGETAKTGLVVMEEGGAVREINIELLPGSWEDTSPAALHFTLFQDGTARSDNMRTLLYKKWRVEEDQVIFTIESIGNGTSFTAEDTCIIQALTKDKLVLKKGTALRKYRAK